MYKFPDSIGQIESHKKKTERRGKLFEMIRVILSTCGLRTEFTWNEIILGGTMQRAALKYLHSNCSFVSIICFHVAFFMQRRLWRRKKNVPCSDLNCCKIKQERPLGSRTIMGKKKVSTLGLLLLSQFRSVALLFFSY